MLPGNAVDLRPARRPADPTAGSADVARHAAAGAAVGCRGVYDGGW